MDNLENHYTIYLILSFGTMFLFFIGHITSAFYEKKKLLKSLREHGSINS